MPTRGQAKGLWAPVGPLHSSLSTKVGASPESGLSRASRWKLKKVKEKKKKKWKSEKEQKKKKNASALFSCASEVKTKATGGGGFTDAGSVFLAWELGYAFHHFTFLVFEAC